MATVIPNPSNSFRLSGGGRRGRSVLHKRGSVEMIPSQGRKLTPAAGRIDPMKSVVRLPGESAIPTNNLNGEELFKLAYPG